VASGRPDALTRSIPGNERREVNEDDYHTSGVLSEYLGRNAWNDESPSRGVSSAERAPSAYSHDAREEVCMSWEEYPRRNYDVLCGYIMGTKTCRGESVDSLEDMKSLLEAKPVQPYSFLEPQLSLS